MKSLKQIVSEEDQKIHRHAVKLSGFEDDLASISTADPGILDFSLRNIFDKYGTVAVGRDETGATRSTQSLAAPSSARAVRVGSGTASPRRSSFA